MNVPGPVQTLRGQAPDQPSTIMYNQVAESGVNAFVTFYDASYPGLERYGDACLEKFSVLQERAVKGFYNASPFQKTWGPCISLIQDRVMAAQGRSLDDYTF